MIVPNLNPNLTRTYQIVAPVPSHFRHATCEEVQCGAYVNGWETILPAGDARADYIRNASGRRFVEKTENGITTFTFPAGQACFAAGNHRVSLEREPIFKVRERGQTTTHTRPELWTEDFAGYLDKVRRIKEG